MLSPTSGNNINNNNSNSSSGVRRDGTSLVGLVHQREYFRPLAPMVAGNNSVARAQRREFLRRQQLQQQPQQHPSTSNSLRSPELQSSSPLVSNRMAPPVPIRLPSGRPAISFRHQPSRSSPSKRQPILLEGTARQSFRPTPLPKPAHLVFGANSPTMSAVSVGGSTSFVKASSSFSRSSVLSLATEPSSQCSLTPSGATTSSNLSPSRERAFQRFPPPSTTSSEKDVLTRIPKRSASPRRTHVLTLVDEWEHMTNHHEALPSSSSSSLRLQRERSLSPKRNGELSMVILARDHSKFIKSARAMVTEATTKCRLAEALPPVPVPETILPPSRFPPKPGGKPQHGGRQPQQEQKHSIKSLLDPRTLTNFLLNKTDPMRRTNDNSSILEGLPLEPIGDRRIEVSLNRKPRKL